MTRPAFPTSRSRAPLLALIVFVTITMGMLAWSNYRWEHTLAECQIAQDRLADSRRALILAELQLERLLRGDPASTREQVVRYLAQARDSSRALATAHHGGVRLAHGHAEAAEMAEAASRYAAAVDTMAQTMLARLSDKGKGRQHEQRGQAPAVEQSAVALENAILRDTAERRRALHRQDALNIAIVGLLTLGLYVVLARTERRRAAALAALVDSEARLQAIVAGLPGIAFLLDANGEYLDVFGSNSELLLEPADLMMRRRITDVLPPAAVEGCLRTIRQTLAARRTTTYEYQLTVNGRQRWFDARVAPVGNTDTVIWLAWDVTERRQAEHRVRELSRLYGFLSHVNQACMHATTPEALYARACAAARHFGGFKQACVAQADDPVLAALLAQGHEQIAEAIRPGGETAAEAWEQGRVVCFTRLEGEDHTPAWAALVLQDGMTACAAIPLRREQQLVALLLLATDTLDLQRPEECELLQEIGDDISHAVTRLDRDARHAAHVGRIRLLAAALESSRDGIMITRLDGTIVSVNRAFVQMTGYDEAQAVGRTPALLRSGAHGADFYRALNEALARDGSWRGEIWNRTRHGAVVLHFLSISTVQGEDGNPDRYIGVLTDLTRLKQTEDRLDTLTYFDPLTGLPNRLLLRMRLEQQLAVATAHRERLGILLIDLDRFKTVNDGLGHAAGDTLLQAVANRLQQQMGPRDLLGREGGDEFVIVRCGAAHADAGGEFAQQVLADFSRPFHVDGQELFLQISIGMARYPEDGAQAGELIRRAQAAVHEAKRSGGGSLGRYATSLTSAASHRLTLEARLRRALQQDRFELHYQPLVDLRRGKVVGAEAVLRLQDEEGEAIGPAQYIPVLEETGMILEVGRWVELEACRQGRRWLDDGYDIEVLAINLSASEIRSGTVHAQLQQVLAQTGFPPERLELEVTESGLISQGDHAADFLRGLKTLGIKLAIDDFGTGYSSLAYLRDFPVDKLKIDRGFIQHVPLASSDRQVVATIVALAKELSLKVVAEGVENEDQLALLRSLDCDLWQGYLCSPPLPAGQFAARFLAGTGQC